MRLQSVFAVLVTVLFLPVSLAAQARSERYVTVGVSGYFSGSSVGNTRGALNDNADIGASVRFRPDRFFAPGLDFLRQGTAFPTTEDRLSFGQVGDVFVDRRAGSSSRANLLLGGGTFNFVRAERFRFHMDVGSGVGFKTRSFFAEYEHSPAWLATLPETPNESGTEKFRTIPLLIAPGFSIPVNRNLAVRLNANVVKVDLKDSSEPWTVRPSFTVEFGF